MNPIQKVMNSRYKYIFIAAIIMIFVFCVGAAVISVIDSNIKEQQISYTDFTVTDKYVNGSADHYYIVMSDNNQFFDIKNDSFGNKMFKKIKVGEHYNFVIQSPMNNSQQITHIIQVYNDTS